MFNWIKKRMARESSVILPGWVSSASLTDFVIVRMNHRGKPQRICLVKTSKGDLWEIRDAE